MPQGRAYEVNMITIMFIRKDVNPFAGKRQEKKGKKEKESGEVGRDNPSLESITHVFLHLS